MNTLRWGQLLIGEVDSNRGRRGSNACTCSSPETGREALYELAGARLASNVFPNALDLAAKGVEFTMEFGTTVNGTTFRFRLLHEAGQTLEGLREDGYPTIDLLGVARKITICPDAQFDPDLALCNPSSVQRAYIASVATHVVDDLVPGFNLFLQELETLFTERQRFPVINHSSSSVGVSSNPQPTEEETPPSRTSTSDAGEVNQA